MFRGKQLGTFLRPQVCASRDGENHEEGHIPERCPERTEVWQYNSHQQVSEVQ